MKSSNSNSDKFLHQADAVEKARADYESASVEAKNKKRNYEKAKLLNNVKNIVGEANFGKSEASNHRFTKGFNYSVRSTENNKKLRRYELLAHGILQGSKQLAKKYFTPANINAAGEKVATHIPKRFWPIRELAKHSGFAFKVIQKSCTYIEKHHSKKMYHRHLNVADDLLYSIHSSNKDLVKNDTQQLQNVISRIHKPTKFSAKLTTQGLLAFHNDNHLGNLYYIGDATRMITKLSSIRNINNRSDHIEDVSEKWAKGNMLNKLAKGFTQLNSIDQTSNYHIKASGYQKQIDQDKAIANCKKHMVDIDTDDIATRHEMYNVIDKNRIKIDAVDSAYIRNYHKAVNGKFKEPTLREAKVLEETQLRRSHLDTPLKRSSYKKEHRIENFYGMKSSSREKDYRTRLHKAINLYGVKYAPENSRNDLIHYHSFSSQAISSDRNKSLVNSRQFRPASLNNSMANHSTSSNAQSASSSNSSLTAEQIKKYRLTHGGPTI